MRKIIKNKVYDTDTARLQSEWWNGYSITDFHHLSQDLYLKKTGEFFLHITGGALTEYAKSTGDGWAGDEIIKPLSFEEAREWAESHLEASEYEAIFGEVSEDDEGEVGMHVAIPKTLYDKIEQERLRNGGQMKYIVIEALYRYFREERLKDAKQKINL